MERRRRRAGRRTVAVALVSLGAVVSVGLGVALAQIMAQGRDFGAVAGQPFSGEVATFTDSDPRPPEAYDVTIDWGDGSTSGGTVSGQGTYSVSGSHTYQQPGSYTFTVRIDDGQGSATAQGTASVTPPGGPPAAAFAVSPASPVTGSAINFDAGATLAPSGAASYEWDLDGNGTFELACGGSAKASRTYSSPGTYDVGLRVTDTQARTDVARSAVEVGDAGDLGTSYREPAASCGASAHVQPPPGERGAPSVAISSPARISVTDRPEPVRITGRVRAPEGTAAFCTSAPLGSTRPPATCARKGELGPGGRFTGLVVGSLRPGRNVITAWVRDRVGQVARDEVIVDVSTATDVRVTGIDVTQGIHYLDLHAPSPRNPAAPVDYRGIPLVQGKKTIVRVYADAARTTAGRSSVRSVDAVLYGTRDGRTLAPGPLLPDRGGRDLRLGNGAPNHHVERTHPARAYTFTLPPHWTKEPFLELHAQVNPTVLSPQIAECGGCRSNNNLVLRMGRWESLRSGFRVRRPAFYDTYPFKAGVVSLRTEGDTPGVAGALRYYSALSPLADGGLHYGFVSGVMDVSDIHRLGADANVKTRLAMDRLQAWERQYNYRWSSTTVGVHSGKLARDAGLSRPADTGQNCRLKGIYRVCAEKRLQIVPATSPRKIVVQEMFHAYGVPHASPGCGAIAGTLGNRPWPPDQTGRLHSLGLDPLPGSGGREGPYAIRNGPDYRSAMSYCAKEETSWLSWEDWHWALGALSPRDDRFDLHPRFDSPSQSFAAQRTGAGAGAASFHVTASIGPDGKATLAPLARGRDPMPPVPDSEYRLVVRGAGGAVLGDSPMSVSRNHLSGRDSEEIVLQGQAPATGAARVEIVHEGRVLVARNRSRTPPSVQVRTPRPRREAASLTVRWTGSDRDRDPLLASVAYSADAGRTWRPVFVGPDRGRVTLPARLFPASRRGRLRVTLDDGFDATSSLSRRFRSFGAPPLVRILSPGRRQRLRPDASQYLHAVAFDDRGEPIAARRLRWFAGRRKLGRGAPLAVTGLRPGVRHLRVVATDYAGRAGSARVRVRVPRVRPLFLGLRAPRRVSTRARAVRLQVGATLPATLRVRGRSVAVGRRPLAVRVRVPRGRAPLRLRMRIRAAGRSTVRVVRIER